MFVQFLDFYMIMVFLLTGFVVFCSFHSHLLLTLLSLEYLVLFIYMIFIYYISMYVGDMYFVMIFLTFSVCEGVLGLSVLVSMIRCHGNDLVNSVF